MYIHIYTKPPDEASHSHLNINYVGRHVSNGCLVIVLVNSCTRKREMILHRGWISRTGAHAPPSLPLPPGYWCKAGVQQEASILFIKVVKAMLALYAKWNITIVFYYFFFFFFLSFSLTTIRRCVTIFRQGSFFYFTLFARFLVCLPMVLSIRFRYSS